MYLESDNLDKIIYLAEQFANSTKAGEGFDEHIFKTNWKILIDSGMGVIICAENGNQIIGILGIIKFQDPNNGGWISQELFWYVAPQYRGIGMELLEEAERWSKNNNCGKIIMAYLIDSMPEKVKGIYETHGYDIMEINYYKEL